MHNKTITERLDYLASLDFQVSIEWGSEINIWVTANDLIPACADVVLIVETIRRKGDKTFEDTIHRLCDVFDEWYVVNREILNDYWKHYDLDHKHKLEKVSLGWYDG
jgi:hypothetical protein